MSRAIAPTARGRYGENRPDRIYAHPRSLETVDAIRKIPHGVESHPSLPQLIPHINRGIHGGERLHKVISPLHSALRRLMLREDPGIQTELDQTTQCGFAVGILTMEYTVMRRNITERGRRSVDWDPFGRIELPSSWSKYFPDDQSHLTGGMAWLTTDATLEAYLHDTTAPVTCYEAEQYRDAACGLVAAYASLRSVELGSASDES